MSDYKNIIGKGIRFVSSNLDNDQAEGQIWYNSTDGVFRNVLGVQAWSSGGPLINEHQDTSAAGTQTAGLCFGGTPPSNGITNTEEYNGSGWATGGALNTGRRGAARFSASTQTAGLVFGGSGPPNPTVLNATEEYDGSSWTSGNNLPAVKYIHGGAGIQTAALSFAGYSGTAALATTEVYDGTNWTAGNAMSTARYSLGSAGLQTAALAFGGSTGSDTAATEEYDGTNWTSGGDLNTARRYLAGCGLQDAALAFGAGPSAVVKTEKYDGTSWTETADMGIAQKNHGGAGLQGAALSCGGESPTNSRFVTQEFNISANVITAGAWAAGGNLGTARYKISSANAAPQDAALGFGGRAASGDTARDLSEEYNGSTWSEGNNLNNATRGAVGAGTQTAGLRAGGFDGGPAEQDNTEEYDGTSWSNANDMPANMRLGAGCGTQTAGLAFGGLSSPLSDKAVEYDGTNWTVGGTMNTGRYYLAGFGIQTAAVAAGGNSKDDTEEYDGTSWTSVNDVTSGNTQGAAASGILTAGLFFGGTRTSVPANTNITLNYDGTNWSTTASLSTARVALGGAGTSTSGLAFGGDGPPQTAATEEFTGETSALNIKTVSTS
jgi:hypothetical protein